jgi:hypothetical protein
MTQVEDVRQQSSEVSIWSYDRDSNGRMEKLDNDNYFCLPEIIRANGSGEMNGRRYLALMNAHLILSTAA